MVQTIKQISAGEELFIRYNRGFTRAMQLDGFAVPSLKEYKPNRQRLREEFQERFLRQRRERMATARTTTPASTTTLLATAAFAPPPTIQK